MFTSCQYINLFVKSWVSRGYLAPEKQPALNLRIALQYELSRPAPGVGFELVGSNDPMNLGD